MLRGEHVGDDRQLAVIDLDGFGCFLGGGEAGGNDHRHALAHEPNAAGGEQLAVGFGRRRSVRPGEAQAAGDRGDVGQVGFGIHRDNARHGFGGGRVEPVDIGVCVGGAQEERDQHALGLTIGGIIASAGQQPHIFAAADGFGLHCGHGFRSP